VAVRNLRDGGGAPDPKRAAAVNRRALVAGAAALALGGRPRVGRAGGPPPDGGPRPPLAAWAAWKAAHLAPEGRVVDGPQRGVSHSEGQGYGMALAVAFSDRDAFEAMRAWTERTLAVRDDGLLAWRWRPDAAPAVADLNNASDGCLFYAWALARAAGAGLGTPADLERAARIAGALAERCVVPHPDGSGRLLLLPGVEGFRTEAGFVVNPAYAMPRALRELAAATGVEALAACADGSLAVLADMARTGLTPDWAEVTPGGWRPAAGRSADNGYEAMRAPLFLVWSGELDHPAVERQARAHRRAADAPDAAGAPVVMARESAAVIERSDDPGYAAIAALFACLATAEMGAAIPAFAADQPYYPATLHLMTSIAQMEMAPRCFPL
jgi:endoglucanase